MLRIEQPTRPPAWPVRRAECRTAWMIPFHKLEWYLQWIAWALGNWALLEVLEYLGTFSVLIAVIFYFADSGKRTRMRHYTAWTVINTAQGKGGSGGRIEALQELNQDGVPLIGVDVSSAFLKGVDLRGARLSRCAIEAGDLRDSNLAGADLTFCRLSSINLRNANLNGVQLQDADLTDADLMSSSLRGAKMDRVDLTRVDLRYTDLDHIVWKDIASFKLANVYGVRNPPEGFLAYALSHGAVSLANDEDWEKVEQPTQ
jgi:hypothetical protein